MNQPSSNQTTEPKELKKELNIGVCISGGGYRATSFGLGTFSYLNEIEYNEKPLLKHVRALSTVSGGSITGITYAQWTKVGKSFESYFQWLYSTLKEVKIVEESVENYANDSNKNSIIEGFASSYGKYFLQAFNAGDKKSGTHKLLQSITPEYNEAEKEIDLHILYNSINATDFNTGTPYRFIAQLDHKNCKAAAEALKIDRIKELKLNYAVGNGFYELTNVGQLPLHVILASSSCFPGGFEPIMLRLDQFSNKFKNESLALMDGGIVDNQGIDAMIKYHENNNLDLAIVVDSASPSIKKYKEALPPNIPVIGNIPLGNLSKIIYIANVVVLIALIATFNLSNWWTLIFSILLTLLTPVSIILNSAKKLLENVSKNNNLMGSTFVPLNSLKPNDIAQILINRVSSLGLLITTVFMKHLRRMNTKALYVNSTKYPIGRKRFVNSLYLFKNLTPEEEFLKMGQLNIDISIDDHGAGLKRLQQISKNAFEFDTTLWVTKSECGTIDYIKDTIVTGQFTTCGNIIDTYKKETDHPLYIQAVADWKLFLKDPYWLYNKTLISRK